MSDHECERRFQSSVGQVEPIEPRRGAAEQIRFLGRTCCPRQNLAGIPERRVAIGALVDRTEMFILHFGYVFNSLSGFTV